MQKINNIRIPIKCELKNVRKKSVFEREKYEFMYYFDLYMNDKKATTLMSSINAASIDDLKKKVIKRFFRWV